MSAVFLYSMYLHVRAMDAYGISVQLPVFIDIFVILPIFFFDVNLFKKVERFRKP